MPSISLHFIRITKFNRRVHKLYEHLVAYQTINQITYDRLLDIYTVYFTVEELPLKVARHKGSLHIIRTTDDRVIAEITIQ